jgi:hypothetical protein
VREDHRANQADARRNSNRGQGRQTCQHIRAEEDAAQQAGLNAKAHVKPVSHNALHNEATCEGVDRKQASQPQHHAARFMKTDDGLPFLRERVE